MIGDDGLCGTVQLEHLGNHHNVFSYTISSRIRLQQRASQPDRFIRLPIPIEIYSLPLCAPLNTTMYSTPLLKSQREGPPLGGYTSAGAKSSTMICDNEAILVQGADRGIRAVESEKKKSPFASVDEENAQRRSGRIQSITQEEATQRTGYDSKGYAISQEKRDEAASRGHKDDRRGLAAMCIAM
jgi:hypothetical protein